MKSEIDAIREQAILASLAGFPILLVFGIAWIVAGALSFVVPREFVPWVSVLLGVPAMPIALALERGRCTTGGSSWGASS